MTGRPERKTKAAQTFAWLKAVRRNTALLRIDAWTALDLAEWLGDDLTVFRSARMLAESIRCSPSTAAASLARLEAAGLLSRTEAKGPVSPSGGRRANTYTIAIPQEVFTDQPVETSDDQERVFTDPSVTNTLEQPLEHDAEAPQGPSASTSTTGSDKGDGTGAFRACPSPGHDLLSGEPVTLADLDRIAEERRLAEIPADAAFFTSEELRELAASDAALRLAELHPDGADPGALANDLVAGFTGSDAAARPDTLTLHPMPTLRRT